jgi:2-polyprenyl-6-methoxyphenol hydroxylase-like FAD-dependent oxidoreductase
MQAVTNDALAVRHTELAGTLESTVRVCRWLGGTRRGDLAGAIYATIANDVETIFDDGITAIDEHPDGVSVSFAQAKTRDFDLVIGADGLHSNVRRLTFGSESDVEHYLGCLVAACVVEGYRPRDELVYVTHSQPGRSIGRFSLRGDRTMFMFVFGSEQAADPGDLDARKALLRREFGHADRNARKSSLRSMVSMSCTSTSSARSAWIAGRGADRCSSANSPAPVGITDEPSTRTRRDCTHSSTANRPRRRSLSRSSRHRRGWASDFATW